MADRITCHTLHLNKPVVFTLSSQGSKKVVKSVIDAVEREVAVDGVQNEPDDVSTLVIFCQVLVVLLVSLPASRYGSTALHYS